MGALPKWLAASRRPLRDYLDEYGEIPSAATLRALFALAKPRDPSFAVEKHVFPTRRYVWQTWGREGSYVYERSEDGTFSRSTPEEFLEERLFHDDLWEYYGDPEARFHREFWQWPTVLYHGTSDIHGVLSSSLEARSATRGLHNRFVSDAVFATLNPEVAATYGDTPGGGVVSIDAVAMKRDGYTPRVGREPSVVDAELADAMAHALELTYDPDSSDPGGDDPDTVIVYGDIPAKYLARVA